MCSLFDQFIIFDIRKLKENVYKKRINIDQYLYELICDIINVIDIHILFQYLRFAMIFDMCFFYVCVYHTGICLQNIILPEY